MPHLIVKLVTGHSDAVKQELAHRLTGAVLGVLGHDGEAVSIALVEVAA